MTLRRPVFLVNSRLDLFTATHVWGGHPFFRSYGAILPSSLERVISRPLVFSTSLPVSVSGTGNCKLTCLELFLEARLCHFPTVVGRTHASTRNVFAVSQHLDAWTGNQHPADIYLLRPSAQPTISTGILTRCPSTTPFGLALGPD